jgi:hypothetical protein
MNTQNPIPLYVGITDFLYASQVRDMGDLVPPSHRRSLMNGFMMSYKVFNGLPSRWRDVWIPSERLYRVCVDEYQKVFNALHWADYEGLTTIEDLFMVCQNCGLYLNALQLDMIWPAPVLLDDFAAVAKIPLILQIGANALEAVGNDPVRMLKLVNERRIHGVLLDKSMGRGKGMEAAVLRPFVEILFKERPDLRIAVAGGLGPDTLDLVKPLMDEFPDLSIDAQGKLRPSGSALDPVDWGMAGKYLSKALSMFP